MRCKVIEHHAGLHVSAAFEPNAVERSQGRSDYIARAMGRRAELLAGAVTVKNLIFRMRRCADKNADAPLHGASLRCVSLTGTGPAAWPILR